MPIALSPASELPASQLADILNTCYEDYATPIHFEADQFDPEVGCKSGGRALMQNLHLMFKTTPQLPNEPVESQLNFLFAAMAYQVVLRQREMTMTM